MESIINDSSLDDIMDAGIRAEISQAERGRREGGKEKDEMLPIEEGRPGCGCFSPALRLDQDDCRKERETGTW